MLEKCKSVSDVKQATLTFNTFLTQAQLVVNQQKHNTSNEFQMRRVPPEKENIVKKHKLFH